MFDTTQDLMYFFFGVSVFILTLFLCWGIFYLVLILRQANKVMASVRDKIDRIDRIIRLIQEKLEKTSGHFSMVTDSAIKLISLLMEKHRATKGKKK